MSKAYISPALREKVAYTQPLMSRLALPSPSLIHVSRGGTIILLGMLVAFFCSG